MPNIVDGQVDVIDAITTYAQDHNPALFDCRDLIRIEFNAAGHLLRNLAPMSANSQRLEFHNVNHLVMALFNVIGLKDIARILPRKS